MAYETGRFSVDITYLAVVVYHAMRVDLLVAVLLMTEKTDVISAGIRPAPQEAGFSCKPLTPVNLMAGQASDLTVKQGETFLVLSLKVFSGSEIDRVVVVMVMVAVETDRRRINSRWERAVFSNFLGFHPVTGGAGWMTFLDCPGGSVCSIIAGPAETKDEK